MPPNEQLRQLPGVEKVAHQLRHLEDRYPHAVLVDAIRHAVDAARAHLLAGHSVSLDIAAQVEQALHGLNEPSLRRVINATGVILHTNLGRAPLAALEAISGYSNLEYDLATGKRGKRDVHVGPWLERLCGKPGIAVNNNAAAVYLVLNELAAGSEVIVSRGELIEIGDGFRIPDIMLRAGVVLREVGTTNRTRIEDYRAAITDRTKLLLKVHPSNFRIEGFAARPSVEDLARLGRECGIPVYEDLGSGCMVDLSKYGIDEPLVKDSLSSGANVVSFSGDKLLGGPQAGLIAGDAELVARIRRNPMFRALRLDKMILEHMERTLRSIALERLDEIPILRMIRMSAAEVRMRAEAVLGRVAGIRAELVEGESRVGGGSTPEQALPTCLIALNGGAAVERQLREGTPPVIGRISGDRALLDLRTVLPEDEDGLVLALTRLV